VPLKAGTWPASLLPFTQRLTPHRLRLLQGLTAIFPRTYKCLKHLARYGEARRRRVHRPSPSGYKYDILKKPKKTRKHFNDISLNITKNDLGTTLLY
jgi:hypothetical protein